MSFESSSPLTSAWQAALDPGLVQRLQRPLQPGVMDSAMAGGIVQRSRQFQTRLPLISLASRHQLKTSHSSGSQLPIVYASERSAHASPESALGNQPQPQVLNAAPASPPLVVQAKFAPAAAPAPRLANSTPASPPPAAVLPRRSKDSPDLAIPLPHPLPPPEAVDSAELPLAAPLSSLEALPVTRSVAQAAAVVAAFATAQPPELSKTAYSLADESSFAPINAPFASPSAVTTQSITDGLAAPQVAISYSRSPEISASLSTPSTVEALSHPRQPNSSSSPVFPFPLHLLPSDSAFPIVTAAPAKVGDGQVVRAKAMDSPLPNVAPIAPRLPVVQVDVLPLEAAESVMPSVRSPSLPTSPAQGPNQSMPLIAALGPAAAEISRSGLPPNPSPINSSPPKTAFPNESTRLGGEVEAPALDPAEGGDRIDLETLTHQVERRLMRRLAIERERRGQQPWR
ncbi:hypothetical protein [Phormidium tenue]|uniref:Uncharacterized protein n=1 Tax=Phormidium tenue NIES-30 TaxID=549789 RepID=A0A1U7IY10_9CYAN|nr:hypothetical protein [Phormidium tenue]MBD2233302.1 hypothetical protein [Phormidium tenue FACHB-1052]OKH43266.1 hypothetical protein NIES30_25280 [Phormidium tenue NIES-30]